MDRGVPRTSNDVRSVESDLPCCRGNRMELMLFLPSYTLGKTFLASQSTVIPREVAAAAITPCRSSRNFRSQQQS